MLFQRRKARQGEKAELPRHIGIIMDGNGRWAKKRGLPRMAGHRAGAQVFRKIARYCNQIGIQCLTVYAFSTENWKRPKEEVDSIMELFRQYLREALEDFKDENIVTRFIGDRSVLAPDLIQLMDEAEKASADKTGMVLNIAINYGGRQEIVYAARRLARQCLEGNAARMILPNRLWVSKWIPQVNPIQILSFGQAERCAHPISCCGSRPIRSIYLITFCGRTLRHPILIKPLKSIAAVIVALAAYDQEAGGRKKWREIFAVFRVLDFDGLLSVRYSKSIIFP